MEDIEPQRKKLAELVFIPSPGIGHIMPTADFARLLLKSNDSLFITILILKLPFEAIFATTADSITVSEGRLRFIHLPIIEDAFNLKAHDMANCFMETYKPLVKTTITKLREESSTTRLTAFFIDMFSTTMIDIANEFGLPTYVFYTSGAGCLSMMFHLQNLYDCRELDLARNQITIPGFDNPVPVRILPHMIFNEKAISFFLSYARRYRETKGIVINTSMELESSAITSLSYGTTLPVYPVGPVLNLNRSRTQENQKIMSWLDDQPLSSVVFLCFGSVGSFDVEQVREIAYGLEQSGQRFLWSLRKRPPKGIVAVPDDYSNPDEILPVGFLNRTKDRGMVIGWAPQADILSHKSVGGFVSHCGWNSVVESLSYGVPIATWPMVGEQQINAFEMVVELELAIKLRIDYREKHFSHDVEVVSGEEIQRVIRCLMEHDSEIRRKVKTMSQKIKEGLKVDGSSHSCLASLIQELLA